MAPSEASTLPSVASCAVTPGAAAATTQYHEGMKEYIDFHTHHPSLRGERVIQDGVDTRGRHPWHLSQPVPPHKTNIMAIGESGLDRLCDTPYDQQLLVFREEVAISEELQLPLFLHCVRAIDDVLRIRHELHARQPIIWHGYRGSTQQLEQLLPHGFYFSFGHHFNAKALQACPLDRLLLETDDDLEHPISELYRTVAQQLNIPLDTIIQQMHTNFHTLFSLSRETWLG